MAQYAEEHKQLDARLEEAKATLQEIEADLESKGYRIENDEVVPLVELEPLREWAVAANAEAAKRWAEISEKSERCEISFNLRINGVMQILQSQPGQEIPYLALMQKYLTGGSEEDVCDPAHVEDEKASEDEDEKETKPGYYWSLVAALGRWVKIRK